MYQKDAVTLSGTAPGERDPPSVGGPDGREHLLVVERRDPVTTRPIPPDGHDVPCTTCVVDVSDPSPIRRPCGIRLKAGSTNEKLYVAAVWSHGEDVVIAVAIAVESYPFTIGRPRGVGIYPGGFREVRQVTT